MSRPSSSSHVPRKRKTCFHDQALARGLGGILGGGGFFDELAVRHR